MASDVHEFTELLQAHARGDGAALDRLFPKVYDELRQMARGRMRHERADHTLGATELVHEAFFRLVRLDRIDWKSRAHFLAMASQAMRNVLLDHAEHRGAQKRGGGERAVTLERVEMPTRHLTTTCSRSAKRSSASNSSSLARRESWSAASSVASIWTRRPRRSACRRRR